MRLGEGHLAGMGKICNSGLLERKALNMRSLVKTLSATGITHHRSSDLADCQDMWTDFS